MNERPDILIAGATGFIGSHLATRLAKDGQRVRALVRASSPAVATSYLRELGAELVIGDLADRGSLRTAVVGATIVFHLDGGGRLGMSEQVQRQINAGDRALPMRELIGLAASQLGVEAPTARIPVAVARLIAVVAERWARLVGGRPMLSQDMVTGFTGNLSVDIGKARRELGFVPAAGLEEAIAASARWYEANGYL